MSFQEAILKGRKHDALQVLNCDRILLLIADIGLEITLRVIEKSKTDFKQYLDELLVAGHLENPIDLRVTYHSIAGVAAMFGADKLHFIASQAEAVCLQTGSTLLRRNKCDVADALTEYLDTLQKFNVQALYAQTKDGDREHHPHCEI